MESNKNLKFIVLPFLIFFQLTIKFFMGDICELTKIYVDHGSQFYYLAMMETSWRFYYSFLDTMLLMSAPKSI